MAGPHVRPRPEVRVRNVETNYSQAFTTGPEGLFRFPALPLGAYEVAVEAKGFQRFLQSGVTCGAPKSLAWTPA